MKWILVNLLIFSGFSQECSWNGLGNLSKEEITSFLIQRAKDKVDLFLNGKGIVKASEDPLTVEIITNPEWGSDIAEARYHYKLKTSEGNEISTDPSKENYQNQNYFYRISFTLWTERDPENNPLRSVCTVYFRNLGIPLFNLTLDNLPLGRLDLFDYSDIFQFNIPISSNPPEPN